MSMIASVYSVSEEQIASAMTDLGAFAELTRYDSDRVAFTSLEKAWHGLHFLLDLASSSAMGR